jgi:hypothetical protein
MIEVGNVAYIGDEKYKVLDRKPEGNRWIGRPIWRWEGSIKVGLRGKGWKDVEWIHFVWIKTSGWVF